MFGRSQADFPAAISFHTHFGTKSALLHNLRAWVKGRESKSATLVSTDKESGKSRCSVLITADIIEMMLLTKQASESDIPKIREEAPKNGLPLTQDHLVSYIVQPLASGQNYVTLLR